MSSDSTALGDRMNVLYGDERIPWRIWEKIYPEPNTGCWLWGASLAGGGYGQVHYQRRTRRAHQLVFEVLVNPVPVGFDLDHLCRVRWCVNPEHLEPVTRRVNLLRGVNLIWMTRANQTHCKNNHLLSANNVTYYKNARYCRACHLEASRRYKIKMKQKNNE